MKFIKLKCDRYHCDTEFLVQYKEEDEERDYYICPVCESMVWINEKPHMVFSKKGIFVKQGDGKYKPCALYFTDLKSQYNFNESYSYDEIK